jgi:hypothetical protein
MGRKFEDGAILRVHIFEDWAHLRTQQVRRCPDAFEDARESSKMPCSCARQELRRCPSASATAPLEHDIRVDSLRSDSPCGPAQPHQKPAKRRTAKHSDGSQKWSEPDADSVGKGDRTVSVGDGRYAGRPPFGFVFNRNEHKTTDVSCTAIDKLGGLWITPPAARRDFQRRTLDGVVRRSSDGGE